MHPSDPNVIFAGDRTQSLFRSNDHGQTWTHANNGIKADIVYDVEINPNDSTHILVGTISGVYEKKGDQEWTNLLEGTARSVLFDPANSQIMYAGMEGIFAKFINGNWSETKILTGPGEGDQMNFVSDIAVDPTDTNTIYISVNELDNIGAIQKSTDGGGSFAKVLDVKRGDPNDYYRFEDPNDYYRFEDPNNSYRFNIVCIDPSNSQHIFAGGGNFLPQKILGDLWESTNGGSSWQRSGLRNVIVNSVLIDPSDPNILYAGTGFSSGTEVPLYKSIDGGVTWIESLNGIPGGPDALLNAVTDLEFHRQDANIVYAGTRGKGIYISVNNAKKWLNLGTPDYLVNAIAVSSLYGATEGGLLQLTGTGCLYGRVYEASSQANINGAYVYTEFCDKAVSINGQYMMVAPAGDFFMTAIAFGYANSTQEDVILYGGDAIRADFPMQSGVPWFPSCLDPNIPFLKDAGKYCFIDTAICSSPLAIKRSIPQKCRDGYLLTNPFYRKLFSLPWLMRQTSLLSWH